MNSSQATQLTATRVVIGFHGTSVDSNLASRLEEGRLGGVIWFARNVESVEQIVSVNEELIGRTQKNPIFISVDQEGGPVARFRDGFTQFPAMGTLGAIDDISLTERVATVMGKELFAVGINLNFAPVVDVNTNPDNPVIGARAFGSDPSLVSRHAEVFVKALQATGVMASAKHFPGHGDTDTDSHEVLPSVNHNPERMEQVELFPFAQMAACGVATIMTAHVMYPALDQDLPATLSRSLLQGVLREKLCFSGVCVSDDLEMKAITQGWGVPQAAVLSVAAGADLVLVCHTEDAQFQAQEALAKALVDRAIDESLFLKGEKRLANLKSAYLSRSQYQVPNLKRVREFVGSPEHMAVGQEVTQRAEAVAYRENGDGGGAGTSGDTSLT